MDLVLLTVVTRLVIGPGRRGVAFYLMPAAVLALFVTDFVYSYISVQGLVYDQSGYLEAGWASFYILWGAAALHQSMSALSERAPEQEIRLARVRLVLLGVASLTAQIVRTIQLIRGENNDLWIITVSTTILFILVVIRMAGLVHKLELSFGREKALRTAGAVLVTATNRESIYSAAMQAVSPLTNQGRARLWSALDDGAATATWSSRRRTTATSVVGTEIDIELVQSATTCSRTVPTDARRRPQLAALLPLPGGDVVRADGPAVPALGAERTPRRRQRRQAAPLGVRRARSAVVAGRARARERGADRGSAPPAERSALLVARAELLRRDHGRRCRLDDSLHEPVGRSRHRIPGERARRHAS